MRELLFADDSALVAHSAEEMQKIVDAFSDASKKFGLKFTIASVIGNAMMRIGFPFFLE